MIIARLLLYYMILLQSSIQLYFDQNHTIAAFTDTNTNNLGLVSIGSGFFELPTADFTGYCEDNTYIKYEQSVTPKSCLRKLEYSSFSLFSTQCVNDYSVNKYVQNLWIAR